MNKLVFMTVLARAGGCASYSWKTAVPAAMRTVQVPTFRNSSDLTETGSVVTRQLLREFQREGTFRVLNDGAALEVQGRVLSAGASERNADYKSGSRLFGGTMKIVAEVSVVDKRAGRVLVDNRRYSGEAPFSSGQDRNTALRDAAPRAADDLARRLVDDILDFKYNVKEAK